MRTVSENLKRYINNNAVQLFSVSCFALFLELVVIRWLSSSVRIFAFLKNIPLITSFLGLGLGIMTTRPRLRIKENLWGIYVLLMLLLSTSRYSFLSKVPIPSGDDLWIWWSSESFLDAYMKSSSLMIVASWAFYIFVVAVVLILLFLLFFSIGQSIQERLKKFKPLDAYKYDLLGSIFGVLLFTLVSFLRTSPFWWILISTGFLLVVKKSNLKKVILLLLVLLMVYVGTLGTYWSPYYRIEVGKAMKRKDGSAGAIALTVNHVYFQQMANFSEDYLNSYASDEHRRVSVNYNLPYMFVENPGDVLVVGAGGGNDVAAALRHGAKNVDAVDIDPVILQLGRKFHPERPYQNSNVTQIVDDARSYFEKTDKKYDTIVYGLLDSHTTSSTFSNIRLDNFVYTLESFSAAKEHLKDDGQVILSFAAGKPWILNRISEMLKQIFDTEVLAFRRHEGADGGIFIAGDNLIKAALQDEQIKNLKVDIVKTDKQYIPTDDWPYLYLKSPSIPRLYLVTLLVVTMIFLLLSFCILDEKQYRKMFNLKGERGHFFFLGAAFLLIEVKSINQLSLLFGSTWLVNSAVIFGILSMALFANALIKRNIHPPMKIVIVGLLLSILIGYFVNFSKFAGSDLLTKFVVASFILALPLFFSGLLFSHSFKRTKAITDAFGANLFGAFLGGMVENVGMIIGINALAFLALFFYFLAIRVMPYRSRELGV